MLELIERVRERLQQGAYSNEAAVSHGVVSPILHALGWDMADPQQVVPEYSIERGRVDFALFGLGHRPAIFIEVKQVGRAVDGDRQLFEYAFHQGVPLCLLTDGREWSFYLPSGQGSYEDRRVYRLQIDDRAPAECSRVLNRYLARDRVRNQLAFDDAQCDYRDAAGRREAVAKLPRAWTDLVAEAHELVIEALVDKAEALCGYKPSVSDAAAFLRTLAPVGGPGEPTGKAKGKLAAAYPKAAGPSGEARQDPAQPIDRSVNFILFGETHRCANAGIALVQILSLLAARNPTLLPKLAETVRSRKRAHVGRSPQEINPDRPEIARAVEISPGWLVGLNIANREKMAIIRAAADIWAVEMPTQLAINLPNA